MSFNPNIIVNKILWTLVKKKKKCRKKKRNILKADFRLPNALSTMYYSYFQTGQRDASVLPTNIKLEKNKRGKKSNKSKQINAVIEPGKL